MQTDTSKMRLDARMIVNATIREWLADNAHIVDATCIASELFTGLRKTTRVVILRKRLRTFLRAELRVRYFPRARRMPNLEVRRIDDVDVPHEWQQPSLVLLATMTGVDHSGLVKKGKQSNDKNNHPHPVQDEPA